MSTQTGPTGPIGTALRELADGADPHPLPGPHDIRARGDQRRRRGAAALGTAGLAVAASAVAVAVVTLGGPAPDGAPRPADPLPTPTVTAPTESAPVEAGTHPIAPAGERFSSHAVAADATTYVVVGDASTRTGVPGSPVYWSADGVTWTAPAGDERPQTVNVTDVIHSPAGFLAVGAGGSTVHAWHSDDGRAWTPAPVEGATGRTAIWGVDRTRLGYVAWGFEGRDARIWWSTDGTSWRSTSEETALELPGREAVCSVRDVEGGGVVALGVQSRGNNLEAQRISWRSTDGETWELREGPGTAPLWCTAADRPVHTEAVSQAGRVSIEPNGDGASVRLEPVTPSR